jgi:DNA gyrase subunit A
VAKGLAVVNLFSIPPEEKVADMVVITNFDPNLYLLMGTRNGEIKKTSLDHFTAVRSSGLIGMDVEKDDELTSARIATESDDVVMVTKKGQSIRFAVDSVRTSQRTSGGVKGIKLFDGDIVVGMGIASPGSYVLVVTTEGYGKLSQIERYPKQHRAGSGVRTIKLVEKTGELADARIVSPSQQVMFISANGIVTRTPVKEISILDRSTQGVRLMRMDEGDHVVAVAHMEST